MKTHHKNIRQVLVERDVPVRAGGGRTKAWAWSLQDAHDRYVAGESTGELARDLGISQPGLLKRFHIAGLPIRTRGEAAQMRCDARRARLDPQEEACRLYTSGLTLDAAAKELGVSTRFVWNSLRRAGIDRRPRTRGGSKHPTWTGGYTYDKEGYILVRRIEHPDANNAGYVRAHRLVMETKLGRELTPGEVVDHIDGDTSNNHPDNLRLFANNGDHLRTTRTGRSQMPPVQRQVQRLLAVQRACQRLVATLEALENDAHWSHVAWPRPSTAPRTTPRAPSGTAPPMFAQRSSPEVSTPER
jgi:hypothetical protein